MRSGNKFGQERVGIIDSSNEINQHIVKTVCPVGGGRLLRDYRFRSFLDHIRGEGLLGVVLGITVVPAPVCSSMGTTFNARLTSPVQTNQQASSFEDDGSYQPPRSPGFHDLFGS
jgi:hypothetical protein